MTIIRPISDLRNDFKAISEVCHKGGEPVFLTKNGKGDLVVMSLSAYEKKEARLDLYRRLAVAEKESADGVRGTDHHKVMQRLRERVHG